MTRRRTTLIAVAAVVLVALVATALWLRLGPDENTTAGAARTTFPGLVAASGEPELPSLTTLHPEAGTAVPAAGPFDDRFELSRLRFDGRAVTGTATITSDVSDLLEFEALAGFYDRDGALLGTARDSYHLDESTLDPDHEGPPEESRSFTIAVPATLQGQAVSAAVGVPVLVNE